MLRRAFAAAMLVLLVAAGGAAALTALPGDGSQLNNDPAAGIAPTADAGSADRNTQSSITQQRRILIGAP